MSSELLSAGRMDATEITFGDAMNPEDLTAKEEFIARISRGGLLKPSDAVYVVCLHAYTAYDAVKSNIDAFNYLISASNSRSVFTKYFLDHANDSNALESVLETSCKNQHTLSSYLQRITETLFNVMAKNYVSEMNDMVHKGKKRTTVKQKQSTNAKRVRKLQSN